MPPGLLLVLLLVFALADHGIRHRMRLDACERPGPGTNDLGAHRGAAGISQEELARDAGVSLRTIVAIENGRHEPGVVLALSLARRLGVRAEDLFPSGVHSG